MFAGLLPMLAGVLLANAAEPEPASRPQAAGRIVRVFDFEEKEANPNDVPRWWDRVYDPGKAGLPNWNQAEIVYDMPGDSAHAASGVGAVRLPTTGGGTRLMLSPGVIPVFLNADYHLTARVRTDKLVHARARLSARFLDREGQPVPGTERASELVHSEGAWTDVRVEVPGTGENAAFLQLQLDVVQPSQLALKENGRSVPDDYEGAAWFDDIAVLQLPRVELVTTAPLNIVVSPARAELESTVRDLTGQDLIVSVDVFDARGERVDGSTRPVGSGVRSVRWQPKLPELGWYRAVMTLTSHGRMVGGDSVDFVVVPPAGSTLGEPAAREIATGTSFSPERSSFGILLNDTSAALAEKLPEAPARLGTGAMALPIVLPAGEKSADKSLMRACERLLMAGQDVTLVIPRVPEVMCAKRGLSTLDVWGYASAEPKGLMEWLDPWLDRFGDRVARWQLGRADEGRVYWRGAVRTEARSVGETLRHLVPGASIVMPRRFDEAPLAGLSHAEQLAFVPHNVPAGAMHEQGSTRDRDETILAFEVAPEGELLPRAAAAQLAQRAIEAWAGGGTSPSRMTLVDPWTLQGPRSSPAPELAAWGTLAAHLCGRRVVARVPSPEGTVCYLLAPVSASSGGSGAIVGWNEWAEPSDAALEAYLGAEALHAVDIFGNERALPKATRDANGRAKGVRIPFTEEPVFVEGVDAELVMFLASLAISPDFIESTSEHHEHAITLKNTYATGVSGTVTVVEPARRQGDMAGDEWRITPRSARFTMTAGGSLSLPMSVALPARVETGTQEFVLELNLSGRSEYPPIEVRRRVGVGLKTVRVDLHARREGPDVIVEALVTNVGEKALTLALSAFAPDKPRSPATISGLTPGSQVVRRFVYPGAAKTLRGERVVLTLSDPDTRARLTASAIVE